jgi:DNA-binding IclR family transcriptional regulator
LQDRHIRIRGRDKREGRELAHSNLIQCVIRASDILRLVSRSADGLTLQRVANSLGLKSSTAHNLLRTLVAEGLLEKAPHPPRYVLGPGVASLWEAHAKVRAAKAKAKPKSKAKRKTKSRK